MNKDKMAQWLFKEITAGVVLEVSVFTACTLFFADNCIPI